MQAAFTWQKELDNGVTSDTSYFTPGTVLINDVFNHAQNKQISDLSYPFLLVISFNYTTPKFRAGSTGMKPFPGRRAIGFSAEYCAIRAAC